MDRLTKLGKRLAKDQEMKSAVFELVKGIIDDGHAKLVDNPDVPPGTPLFYLPIHVDKKNYPKYRICQDGVGGLSIGEMEVYASGCSEGRGSAG
jgi:hypothetical protein